LGSIPIAAISWDRYAVPLFFPGRDNYPEACNDAPAVDRAKLHNYIGSVALKFFDTNLGVQRNSPN
jgi:hypothetical protein